VFNFAGQGQNIYKLWKDGQSMEFDKAKFMEKLKELVAYGKKKKSVLEYQRLFPRYAAGCGADGEGI
jgi:hypothetical protein